ncbi:prenylcysteine oxidase 1-like [Littorina saxatilis]|uniref:Prenylcysteine lyase domain-containing protein n=1 Tax=Littorina saxatilis TaxID=31220 RepID=A0AAN9B7A0_9CAEN
MAASTKISTALKMLLCLLLFIPTNQLCAYAQDDEEIPKVGIIGGGIGGTTAAYFLRQLFGDKLKVDILEADKIGGRLALINIGGQDYEAGGAIIHPKNRYMVNFTEQFGLHRKDPSKDTLGLYNSKDGLFFKTSSWKAVTLAKLFWRYGWDVKRIQDWVAEMMGSFERIYDYQNQGMAFTNVEDLLRSMDESFINYTRINCRTMFKDAGFSDKFIDELVMGGLRENYGQTTDAHGFVGAVSMAGVEPGLWAVKGGNKKVPESMLKASGAHFNQAVVTQVFQVKSEGGTVSYEVQYLKTDAKQGEEKEGSKEYDILIVATPLKSESKYQIQFEDFPSGLRLPNVPYHPLEVLFVHGRPNKTYFGVEKLEELPSNIMTTDTEVFFNKLGIQSPVDNKEHLKGKPDQEEGYGVWKTFLNKVPTEKEVGSIFDSRKDLRLVSWKAYPEYTPNMELPSFVLHDRLYYINAVEAAASAMEMSAIGGRNVAILAYNQWFGHFDKIDEHTFPSAKGDPAFTSEGEGRRPDEL